MTMVECDETVKNHYNFVVVIAKRYWHHGVCNRRQTKSKYQKGIYVNSIINDEDSLNTQKKLDDETKYNICSDMIKEKKQKRWRE